MSIMLIDAVEATATSPTLRAICGGEYTPEKTRWAQVSIAGTATVKVEGRVHPSFAWEQIGSDFTATGAQNITVMPEMRMRVSAWTSGAVSGTIENREPDAHVPVITNGLTASKAEDLADDAAVATFTALTAGAASWSILGSAAALFEIDTDGEITLIDGMSLDYETAPSHNITVQVEDTATGGKARATLVLTVTDVADVSPVFTSAATAVAAEGIEDTATIYTATVNKDVSGDTITFSLTDDDDGKFEIHSSTGVVSLASEETLDHETASSHTIIINADDGTNDTDFTVTITVTDVSEANPTFTSAAAISVGEDWADDRVILQVQATADAGTCTFSIDTDADDLFRIDATSGRLRLQAGKAFDYETKQSHSVTVEADDGTNQATQVITVYVLNVMDWGATPVFTSAAAATVAEDIADTEVILTVSAVSDLVTAGIASGITFSIDTDADDLFEIDEDTGEVTVQGGKSLDYETSTSHDITVEADDGFNQDTQDITITVTDVSE